MSMITEQAKRLRQQADSYNRINEFSTSKLLNEAADTIERLNTGWISVDEKMPEDNNYYLVTVRFTFAKEVICVNLLRPSEWEPMKSCGHEVIAYIPIPELYNGGEG